MNKEKAINILLEHAIKSSEKIVKLQITKRP